MMSILLLLAAAAAPAAPPATAPASDYVQLKVGDPRINAANLRPYSGNWRVLEKKGDGPLVEVERSSERFDRVTKDGHKLWRQVQHETAGNTGMSDMLVLTDETSFAPVIAEQKDVRTGALKTIRYEASGAAIECRGGLCPPNLAAPAAGSATATRTVPTSVPTFDYWGGSYALLFATLPLKVGAKFSVPVFHPAQGLIWLKVDVTGKEHVNAGGGRMVEAYRIVTPQTGWIYHVSKKPPYWLRLEYTKKAGGVLQITERV